MPSLGLNDMLTHVGIADDRHEKSRSPPHKIEYRSTSSQRKRHEAKIELKTRELKGDLESLRTKIKRLEDTLEDKDLQI